MKRMRLTVAAVLALALGAGVGIATAGEDGSADGPANPIDMGTGEKLVLVVGGVFPTTAEAQAAAGRMAFGELQGYYVAPVAQFIGLAEAVAAKRSDHVLVSAFRTEAGAAEFAQLALAAGAPALVTPRLENLGGVYVGLGQEAAPDGSGPLTEPIPGVST